MQQGMQSYFRGGFTPFVVFLTAVTVVEAGGSLSIRFSALIAMQFMQL